MFRGTCEEILSKAEDRGTAATPQRVQLLPCCLLLGYCTWYYGVFFTMLPEHTTFLSRLVFAFPVFLALQQVVSCCDGMHHNQSGSESAFSAARSGTEGSSSRHTEDKQQKQSKERRAAACAPS